MPKSKDINMNGLQNFLQSPGTDASSYASSYGNFGSPADTLKYLQDAGYTEEAANFAKANNLETSTSVGGIGGLSGADTLQAGLGIGQLGLGIAGFLDNKKTAEKQRQVMDQQIASNQFALNTAKARAGDISRAFGGKPKGLAASVA